MDEVKTVQHALIASVRESSTFNPNIQVAPVCILWPDKERQWEAVIPALQNSMPELLVFGKYEADKRAGPAIWLKAVIANALEEVSVPESLVPIIYLPGISRAELRAIEMCPDSIKPLAELQYRGALWSQQNGKDWTVNAYMTSKVGGLGLDVAKDKATQDALLMALPEILCCDISILDNKRLEASDFNQLLTSDSVRDLLSWMNSPKDAAKQWSAGRWQALCNETRSNFQLDIEADGVLAAAEKLCACDGAWKNVWQRYSDSPDIYPALVTLLERVSLPDMLADPATYPKANAQDEDTLFRSLTDIKAKSPGAVRDELLILDKSHGARRASLWAKLGKAPWAMILEPLADVAGRTKISLGGLSPEELGEKYSNEGWQTDAAVIQAFSLCENKLQVDTVEAILETIYKPWVADLSERFQKLVKNKGYPGTGRISEAVSDYKVSGEVVFFVDGLRLDIAHKLQRMLVDKGLDPKLSTQWSALPSVTATAKAAVSPVHSYLIGMDDDTDFEPSVKNSGTLSHDRFKKELYIHGWQHLSDDETGDPTGNAWAACGDIDKEGHKSELKLPHRIPLILEGIVDRILELQRAGWRKIRIVTDHGWLLIPGKMPKSNLPVQAVDSRWGRCAQLKQNVAVDGLTLGWYWNSNIPIHYPHGIHSFIAGRAYGHGGVSLQECLVPMLTLEGEAVSLAQASIKSVKWIGLNCKVVVSSEEGELFADLRTKLADSNSSLVNAKELINNKASLMVLDDGNEGVAATVVVYDNDGNILARQPTTVGGEE